MESNKSMTEAVNDLEGIGDRFPIDDGPRTEEEMEGEIYSNSDRLVQARASGSLTPAAEVAYAKRDALLLAAIKRAELRFFAAVVIGENSKEFYEYGKAIECISPTLVQETRLAVAENDRRIADKEDRKIEDMVVLQQFRAVRPDIYSFDTDSTEYYRWYEYGGRARLEPLTKEALVSLGHDTFGSFAFTENEWMQFKENKLGKLQFPIEILQKVVFSDPDDGPAFKYARDVADWTSTEKSPSPGSVYEAMGLLLIKAEFQAEVTGKSLPAWYGDIVESRRAVENSFTGEVDVCKILRLAKDDIIAVMQKWMLNNEETPPKIQDEVKNCFFEKHKQERIRNLRKLENTSGASYTFFQYANEMIEKRDTPEKAEWALVAFKTIVDSIGENGQSPVSVVETLCEHSPGAVHPSTQTAFRTLVSRVTPQLQAMFDESQSIEINRESCPM